MDYHSINHCNLGEELLSEIPETILNKTEEEFDKEIELMKAKCTLLESINFELKNEVLFFGFIFDSFIIS